MSTPHRTPAAPGAPASGVLRPLTWVLLVLSAVGNSVASFATASTPVHVVLGLVTAGCFAVLLTARLRSRRYQP